MAEVPRIYCGRAYCPVYYEQPRRTASANPEKITRNIMGCPAGYSPVTKGANRTSINPDSALLKETRMAIMDDRSAWSLNWNPCINGSPFRRIGGSRILLFFPADILVHSTGKPVNHELI